MPPMGCLAGGGGGGGGLIRDTNGHWMVGFSVGLGKCTVMLWKQNYGQHFLWYEGSLGNEKRKTILAVRNLVEECLEY